MALFEVPGFPEDEKELNRSFRPRERKPRRQPIGILTSMQLKVFEREFESGALTPLPLLAWAGRSVLKLVPRLKVRLRG